MYHNLWQLETHEQSCYLLTYLLTFLQLVAEIMLFVLSEARFCLLSPKIEK